MVDYWHGSPIPLAVGTRLLSIGDRMGSTLLPARREHLVTSGHDPGLVYFTTDRELARAWCTRSHGALLRVAPEGPVDADPDFPGTSFSAKQAVVVEVAEAHVSMRHLEARRAFAAYDPTSFDENGYIRPAERLPELFAASGNDMAGFRKAGRYPNPQRFSWRAGKLRYLTDDLELIVAIKLSLEHP